MPHSMTGFSAADIVVAPFRLAWEIRSVNHRFLELAFRLPDELRSLEPECRDLVGSAVGRGKVDCSLRISAHTAGAQTVVVVRSALAELRALQDEVHAVFPDSRPLSTAEVLRWSGVLKEPDQQMLGLAEPAKQCLAAAIAGGHRGVFRDPPDNQPILSMMPSMTFTTSSQRSVTSSRVS